MAENSLMDELTNDDSCFTRTEKFVFNFTWPQTTGYVKIHNQSITLQLPNISDNFNITTDFYRQHPLKNVSVGKDTIFSTSWIPIHTVTDEVILKDMFFKIYQEYTRYSAHHYAMNREIVPYFHDSLEEHFDHPSVEVSFKQTLHHSSAIEISVKKKKNDALVKNALHAQIFIGPHLMFCSKKHLGSLDYGTFHSVMSYLFGKLCL